MKQVLFELLGGILILAACRQIPIEGTSAGTSTSVSVIQDVTATPSLIPTSTKASIPTGTPTTSITPLPTIPTFRPTFDARTIVTVTPAPPAVCPQENSAVVAEFATPDRNGFYEIYGADDVLTYLNSGVTLDQFGKSPSFDGEIIDLTGDGVSEVVFRRLVRYDVLGCKNGEYQNLFEFATYDFSIDLEDLLDLNKDGIPELIFYGFSRYGFANVYIVEWDGNTFRSLIDVRRDISPDTVVDWVSATDYPKLVDMNGDGLKEIVVVYDVNQLCGGFGGFCDRTPRRQQTTTLAWNGRSYVVKQRNYAPAQYRFQAIQDGDIASSQEEYDKALSLYQEAILSDKLTSYSAQIRDNLRAQWDAKYGTTPTPTPYPIPLDEYPKLAAYAYYRIVLLHLVQNHESDATTVYNTLQQKFGNDLYGHPYVDMATAFWNAYQSTHKMYDGCAAAIQYAADHPEILIPLGSDYHGWQSHTYEPADVCPFR